MTEETAPARGPKRLPAPPAVEWIVKTLEEAGHETWAVGGAIRDELLGHLATDWDFATRARPAEVRRLFRRTVPVGIAHGTVGVLARDGTMYEVTTFRKDVETDGRHAVVSFADRIEDDLARRDFTINAVAWHPLREELFDPFGGAADLSDGVLRTVGEPAERFAEDWLRILRALRFAGRFGLEVAPPTWRALVAGTPSLRRLAPERVREEIVKVLAQDPRPSRSLGLYRASGALAVVAPEIAALVEEAWRSSVAEAEAVRRHRPFLRLVALLARVGVSEVIALLTRLRASNAWIDAAAELVAAGTEPPPSEASDAELRRWLARTGPSHLSDLARLWIARHRTGSGPDPLPVLARLRRILHDGAALAVGDLELDGRDLIRMGFRPGPHFGVLLEGLLDLVLEDPSANRRERLTSRALELAREMGLADSVTGTGPATTDHE